MTISDLQRQRTEDRIRAAADRLLRGQIPPGGSCDIKTLAQEAGVSRASLYRTYRHLKQEFEQRLARLRDAGHQPDRRAAQIIRLTDDNSQLRKRLLDRDQQIEELTTLKNTAISRLAAQHSEIIGLRAAFTGTSNVRLLKPRHHTGTRAAQTHSNDSARSNTDRPAATLGELAEVSVYVGVVRATADLLILLHTFLDAASTAVRTEFGQFLIGQDDDLGDDPAIAAALTTHELIESGELLHAIASHDSDDSPDRADTDHRPAPLTRGTADEH